MHQAKRIAVALSPLEVVQKCPVEVAQQFDTSLLGFICLHA